MNGLKKLFFGNTKNKIKSPTASIEQPLIKDTLQPKGCLLQLKDDGNEEVVIEEGLLGIVRIDDGSTYLLKVTSSKLSIKFPLMIDNIYYCEPGILCWNDGECNFLFRISPIFMHLFNFFIETLEKAARHSFNREDFKLEKKIKFILSLKEKVSFHSGAASFWIFKRENHQFHPINEEPNCRAIISWESGRSRILWLTIISSTTSLLLHRQEIDPDATLHTDRSSLSFIWCFFDATNEVKTFSLRFLSMDSLLSMANEMGNVIFELLNDGNPIPQEDKSYLFKSKFNCDVDMRDAPILLSEDDYEESEEEEEEDSEEEEDHNSLSSKSRNEQMVVGMKNSNMNYVLQDGGKMISIFGNRDSDSNELNLLNQISLPDSMKMLMLHKEDNELLLKKDSTVLKMNLERGQIVEEWDLSCSSLLPTQKYSQLTDEATMIGIDKNSIFGIDTRISGRNKKIPLSGKEYASNVKFSSASTTGAGNIAVGNERGEIRLFSGLGDKRAKTLIPGFGDPIKGVDTSYDGRWIIVTCKTYLLLIDTKEDGSDSNGFLKGMKEKPLPRRLQLLPEHQSYIGGQIDFSIAKFSMFAPQENHEERSIVTSTGNYVITWNMRRIKAGRLFDYQIRKYDENIVADSFKFGKDREIVVTLPNEITLIGGTGMKSPTPSLFGRKK